MSTVWTSLRARAQGSVSCLLGWLLLGVSAASALEPDRSLMIDSERVAGSANVAVESVSIDDSTGDRDGALEPGEVAVVSVRLRNLSAKTLSAQGVIGPGSTSWLRPLDSRLIWPEIAAGDVAAASFSVRVDRSAPCDETAVLPLVMRGDASGRQIPIELTIGRVWRGPIVTLVTGPQDTGTPVAAVYDGSGFAVLATRTTSQGKGLMLARLGVDGEPHGETEVTTALAGAAYALAWSGTEYGVTWAEHSSHGVVERFARFSAAGAPIGSAQTRDQLLDGDESVQLAFSGGAWITAWSRVTESGEQVAAVSRFGGDARIESSVDHIVPAVRGIGLVGAGRVAGLLTLGPSEVLGWDWISADGTSRETESTIPTSGMTQARLAWDSTGQRLLIALQRQASDGAALELWAVPVDGGRASRIGYRALDPGESLSAFAADATRGYFLTHVEEPAGGLRSVAFDLEHETFAKRPRPVLGALTDPSAALAIGRDRLLHVWHSEFGLQAQVSADVAICEIDPPDSDRTEPRGADGPEVPCNGVDDDSNPGTPDAPDVDLDTYDVCGPGDPVNPDGKAADCNDARADVYPGALEFCDGFNNDCDASTDEVVGNRYLSPTGNDTNNLCTNSGTPCSSFNHAIHAACTGELLLVAEGTYNQNVVVDKRLIFDNQGASQNTTVRGSGTGDVVQIRVTGTIWDGVEVRGGGTNQACLRIGGAAFPNVRNVQIGNAAFYDCKQGIVLEDTGNDPTFLGINRLTQVDARDNDGDGSVDSGIGLMTIGVNGRLEIKGGNFRNNAGTGIRFKQPVSGTSTTVLVNGAIIENNGKIAAGSGRSGIEINGGSDVRIEGNDIFGHTGTGAGDDGRGIVANTVSSGFVACSRVRSNDTGIELIGGTTSFNVLHNRLNGNTTRAVSIGASTGTGLALNENLFVANTAGVNHAGVGTLNLRHNWWNAANGPTGAGGSGDSVSGAVDVTNFLARSDEPILVRRPVDSGWSYPTAACYDGFQTAVNAATAGRMLLLGAAAGNPYYEHVSINKQLDLEGVPAATSGGCSPTEIYSGQVSPPVSPAIRITNVSGITVRHLRIHAAGEFTAGCNTHSGDEIGLDLQNVDNSTFSDLCLDENGISEIRLYGDSDNNTFTRLTIDGQLCLPGNGCLCSHRSRYGVLIDGAPVCEGGTGAIANGNKILDSTIQNVTQAVALRLADDTEIRNNTLSAVTTPTWDSGTLAIGVNLKASDDTLVIDNAIGSAGATEAIRVAGKAASDCFTEELNADRTTVQDNVLSNAGTVGLRFRRIAGDPGNSLVASVRCNDIVQNGTGVIVDDPVAGSPIVVTLNDIRTNSAGASNAGVDVFDARRNWWGHASGPSGNGPGTGDSVQGAIDFSNWLSSSSVNDADSDTFTECGGDCNDASAAIKPGAAEVCNATDDDCDGSIDEGLSLITYYRDVDGDSFGDSSVTTQNCSSTPPVGYVANSTDCNDANPLINPLATELSCDGIDQRCNGPADEAPDVDTDTFDVCGPGNAVNPDGKTADCNDLNPIAYPGAPEMICTGVDEACNGGGDEAPDGDTDGADRCGFGDPYNPDARAVDCDDNDPNRAPQLAEVCDQVDNDCDSTVDEGLPQNTYYRDLDADGYGNAASSLAACSQPVGYVPNSTDCNDAQAADNPAASEVCTDNRDNDCDAAVDDADSLCAVLLTSNLRFQPGSKLALLWNAASGATHHALYRGTIGSSGMTAGGYDHRSLHSALSAANAQDAQLPAPAGAFYYLATGLNENGATGVITGGPLGERSNLSSRPDSSSLPAGPRVYVDPDAVSGAGTGLSWANAYTTVSAALAHSRGISRSVEIWVSGTVPSDGLASLNGATRPGAIVLGGFAGTETSAWQRNPVTNPSIWQGDVGQPLLSVQRAGVVIDGMTLSIGSQGVVATMPGGSVELRQSTLSGFTTRAVDVTVDGTAGAKLTVDGCSFDASGQRSISARATAGALRGSIRGSTFAGASEAAIRLEADPASGSALIETSIIRNTVSGGARGVWISARTDDDGFSATASPLLASNVIHHTTVEAIRVESSGAFSSSTASSAATASPQIVGNTLVDGAVGVRCSVSRTDSTATPANHAVRAQPVLWNNLLTHMSGAAVSEGADNQASNLGSDPVLLSNGLFSATPLYLDEGASNLTLGQINALAGNSLNFSSDPLYTNRPASNYHLAAGSPAINAGRADAPLPGEDIDGATRNTGSAPDVGADER